jgi:phospholipid/cholesterol/gamma-HCH transport system ATP-binding protein
MSLPKSTKSAGNPVIEIKDLKIGFEEQLILKNISLKLFEGENLVVMGKSGCGKSVLIKCIVGLLIPNGGSIKVLGTDVTTLKNGELDELRKKIGFLFQGGALYDSMTVKENLEFHLTRIKTDLSETEMQEKIRAALENVGLADSFNKMPSELSGGMRKRVSLARTIVVEPAIMLYDEPTTGSSMIITHDISCARTTADRIVMINNGEIYSEGDFPAFENSTDDFIKTFFNK